MNKTINSVNTFKDINSLMKKYPELEAAIKTNDVTIIHGDLAVMPLKQSIVDTIKMSAPSSDVALSKLAKNNDDIQVSHNNKLKR